MNNSLGKGVTFLFIAIGMGLCVLFVMAQMDVIHDQAVAESKTVAAESDWEAYQYQQIVRSIVGQRTEAPTSVPQE